VAPGTPAGRDALGVPARAAPAAARDRVPLRALTVLYDPDCPLCAFLRDWLVRQRTFVPLDLVAAGSAEARRRFPGLDHTGTLDEITAVGDAGQVYRGSSAWVVTLWALRAHRPLAHRLAAPGGAALARGAVIAAAKWRSHSRRSRDGDRPRDNRPPSVPPAPGSPRPAGRGRWNYQGWTYSPRSGWTYDAPGCGDGTCTPR
jgi:predicted DCC family thiol-disulfide oxidoreductase YuxK